MTWMITNRDPELRRELNALLANRELEVENLRNALKARDLNWVKDVTNRLNEIYIEIGTICANELVWQEELPLED